MAVSPTYREYILDLLSAVKGVSARAMFGGVGLYLDGVMFGLISSKDRFYLRVDDGNRADYEALDSGPFAPFEDKPQGNPMKMPYYEVPVEVLDDPELLTEWARKAWDAARRGADKKSKSAKTGSEKAGKPNR